MDLGVGPQLFHIPCLEYVNQILKGPAGFRGGPVVEETILLMTTGTRAHSWLAEYT